METTERDLQIQKCREYITKAQGGDAQAVTDLLVLIEPPIKSYAFRLFHGDLTEAEDLTSEASIRIWKNIYKINLEKYPNPLSWCLTITRNLYKDHLVKLSRRPKSAGPLPNEDSIEFEHFADSDPTPEEVVVENENKYELVDALNRIPQLQKETLAYFYFLGYSHTQISEATHTPLGTVKTRLQYGLKNLRPLLAA